MHDHEVLFVLGPLVLLLAIACEVAWRNRYVPQWVARKVLHIGAVGACAVVPLWLDDLEVLRWIVIASEIVIIRLVIGGQLFNAQDGRKSWGIMLFPLAYLLLLYIEPERWLISLPMAILALSDSFAAIVGNMWPQKKYTVTGDLRTLTGSTAFFLVTILIIPLYPSYTALVADVYYPFALFLLIGIALIITGIEAICSRGLDNFFIPLAAWLLLSKLADDPLLIREELAVPLGAATLIALLFILLMRRIRWLDLGGAITAAILGLWIIYFAGILWLIPLFLFLIGSTVIGRLSRALRELPADHDHGRGRDALQVLCNGGVFALAASLLDPPVAYIAMAVSIAISAADTWASETGMVFQVRTMDILRWRRVPPGLSGGVSLPGTFGGIMAAILFGLVGAQLIGIEALFWQLSIVITVGGILGMLLDSIIGAAFQARYSDQDGELSDERDRTAHLVSGKKWMTNDLVNLISNASITGLMIFLIAMLHTYHHLFASIF